jgi:hypothetical protein
VRDLSRARNSLIALIIIGLAISASVSILLYKMKPNPEDIETWVLIITTIVQVVIGVLVLIVTSIGAYGFLAAGNKSITEYLINTFSPFLVKTSYKKEVTIQSETLFLTTKI